MSDLLEMQHSNSYMVQSRGFHLQDSGKVFMTLGTPVTDSTILPQLISYQAGFTSTVNYHKQIISGNNGISAGVAASLAHIPGTVQSIYVGGNVLRNKKWHLSLFKIDPSEDGASNTMTTTLTTL